MHEEEEGEEEDAVRGKHQADEDKLRHFASYQTLGVKLANAVEGSEVLESELAGSVKEHLKDDHYHSQILSDMRKQQYGEQALSHLRQSRRISVS